MVLQASVKLYRRLCDGELGVFTVLRLSGYAMYGVVLVRRLAQWGGGH